MKFYICEHCKNVIVKVNETYYPFLFFVFPILLQSRNVEINFIFKLKWVAFTTGSLLPVVIYTMAYNPRIIFEV